MYKVIIDTCSFQNIGLNFDISNNIINSLIKHTNKNIQIIMISIIKNEIINHINESINKEKEDIYMCMRKSKWLESVLNEELINCETNKKLENFYNFLEIAKVIEVDVNDILAEEVFNDYFDGKLPFENRSKKKSEFPDSFISKKVIQMAVNDKQHEYIFISSDEGLKESLNKVDNIRTFTKIQELLSMLTVNSVEIREKICEYFSTNNYDVILDDLYAEANLLYDEDEYIEFDLNHIEIDSMYELDIIDYSEETKEYILGSDFSFRLCGNFIKRNFENSIYDRESNEFVYDEFDNICAIYIPSVYLEVKVKYDNEKTEYLGINTCDDFEIYNAFSFDYIEKNISPNRIDNMIAVWN